MRKLLAILLLLLLPCASAEGDILYFYENFCESCDPVQEFKENFERLTGQQLSGYTLESWNAFLPSGKARFEEFCIEMNLSSDECLLPMMIWNEKIYAGTDAIEYDLPKDCLSTPGATKSTVLLVSCSTCADCIAAEDSLKELPYTWTLSRGSYTFESELNIEIKNTQDADVRSILEAFGLTEEAEIAPCAFLGNRYYMGLDEILENVARAVCVGAAVGGIKAPSSDTHS